jgi:two-component system, OmpR family, response regulator ResD
MRVLVVDDEPHVRALVADVLALDFEVQEATDGAEALELLHSGERYHCVLLDVMMPGLSGLEVLHRVRNNRAFDRTAIVMLTAKAGEYDHLHAFRNGADAYLTKPFDVDDIIETVTEVTGMSAPERVERRRSELDRAELLARIESSFGR